MHPEARRIGALRVLVVDDFATMRRIIRGLLEDLGCNHVCEAAGGSQALQMLRGEEFDVLITDWNMPQMAGIELLRALREDAAFRDLPVLMVTAEQQRDQILLAAEFGLCGYLVKPFTAQALRDKLANVVRRRAPAAAC